MAPRTGECHAMPARTVSSPGPVPDPTHRDAHRNALGKAHAEAQGNTQTHAHDPGLDGLRGLAVVVVMVFHFEPHWLPGGFLGVDTFMVISGFLISRLLLAEWERSGTVSLRAFWGRRARRLLPALFLVLVAVAGAAAAWLPASQLPSLRLDGLAALTYVSNWHLISSHQSYAAVAATPSPLRHMWSLAIEEQYYVVWPLVVVACLAVRRRGRAVLGALCVVGAALSAVAMAVTYRAADPSRAYYGTDTRAQALLVGAGLAVLLHSRPLPTGRWLRVAAACALAGQAMLWAGASVRDGWLYRGGFLAYALTSAVLVTAAMAHGSAARLFSVRPARAIGRVSYGLYLWHWPVTVFLTPVRTGLGGPALLAARTGVTVAATLVSYVGLEQPVRQRRWSDRAIRRLAPASVVAVAAIFLLVALGSHPLPRYLRSRDVATAADRPSPVVRARKGPSTKVLAATVTATTASASTNASTKSSTTSTPPRPLPRTVVIEGDSVSDSLQDALAQELADRGISAVKSAVPGCGMITGSPLDPDGQPYVFGPACSKEIVERETKDIDTYAPDVVVWISSWEARNRAVDGHTAQLGSPAGDHEILGLMRDAVDRLSRHGARVVVVTLPTPYDTAEVTHPAGLIEAVPKMNHLLRRLSSDDPDRVGLVDLGQIACGPRSGDCPHERDGIQLRADGLHYSDAGSAWVAPRLTDALLTS
ncbi:MAG: hypothetical protein JWM89_3793 [Acidimicrobiales bacterium]|nr:hypothetical protein [Acidimicrobiales bacterium]